MSLKNQKFEKIIPVGKKKFAYQNENIGMGSPLVLAGYLPSKSGNEPYLNDEKDTLDERRPYLLTVERFTGNSVEVMLVKRFKDGSKRCYYTGMSFADLVNQIFRDVEVGESEYETSDTQKVEVPHYDEFAFGKWMFMKSCDGFLTHFYMEYGDKSEHWNYFTKGVLLKNLSDADLYAIYKKEKEANNG